MPQDAAQREIDEALLEVSQELAIEELGGRRRKVWYRSRENRVKKNLTLGKPGDSIQKWTLIDPTPITEDADRKFSLENIGLIEKGDIDMMVDRLAVSRSILDSSEFYINDDPDAPEPTVETPANYDMLGGSINEGGGGIRHRSRCFWICVLRRRQFHGK